MEDFYHEVTTLQAKINEKINLEPTYVGHTAQISHFAATLIVKRRSHFRSHFPSDPPPLNLRIELKEPFSNYRSHERIISFSFYYFHLFHFRCRSKASKIKLVSFEHITKIVYNFDFAFSSQTIVKLISISRWRLFIPFL